MHKKTAPYFVHYGEPEKIEKSFAFNVDIFILCFDGKLLLTLKVQYAILEFHRLSDGYLFCKEKCKKVEKVLDTVIESVIRYQSCRGRSRRKAARKA